jgi:hypothetical protein
MRWLSLGMSIAGFAMSASGVIVLLRGDRQSATAAAVSAPAAATTDTRRTTDTPTTTANSPTPTGWSSCTRSTDHFALNYPPHWTTPAPPDSDACRVFRLSDSGDAGVGFIEVGRITGMSFDAFVASLDQSHGDAGSFTHTTVTRYNRTMLRAQGTLNNNGETMRAVFFVVQDVDGPILARWVSSYTISAADEDTLATIAASVEHT